MITVKTRSPWFWILLLVGGGLALVVCVIVGLIVWTYRDLTSINLISAVEEMGKAGLRQ